MIGMYNFVPSITVEKVSSDILLQPSVACKRAADLKAYVPKTGTWKRYAAKKKVCDFF